MQKARKDIESFCEYSLSGITRFEPNIDAVNKLIRIYQTDETLDKASRIKTGYMCLSYMRYFINNVTALKQILILTVYVIHDEYVAEMVVKRNLIKLLRSIQKKYPKELPIIYSIFNILRKLTTYDSSYQELMNTNVISMVINLVNENIHIENIVKQGCSVIRLLVTSKDQEKVISLFLSTDLIDTLYIALLTYPDNIYIDLHCIYVFSWLIERKNEYILKHLLKQNLFQYIDIIITQQQDDECITKCYMLLNKLIKTYQQLLSLDERVIEFIIASNIIRDTLSLLKNKYIYQNMNTSTYMVLFTSNLCSEKYLTSICVSYGFIPVILDIYMDTNDNVSLLTSCLCFCNTLSIYEEYKPILFSVRFIDILLINSNKYRDNYKYILASLGVLYNLSSLKDAAQQFLAKDIYSYLLQLIYIYIDNINICKLLVGLSTILVTHNKDYIQYFLNMNIIKYITSIIYNHEDDTNILYECLTLLLFLSHTDKGIRQILHAGIEPFIDELLPRSQDLGLYEVLNALFIRLDTKKKENICIF